MLALGLKNRMDQLAISNIVRLYGNVLRMEDGHVMRMEDGHVMRMVMC